MTSETIIQRFPDALKRLQQWLRDNSGGKHKAFTEDLTVLVVMADTLEAANAEQGKLVDKLASLVIRLSRKCSEGKLEVEAIDFINDRGLRVDGN